MSDTETPPLFYIPQTIDVNQLNLDTSKLAKMIDHTKLSAYAKKADIIEICEDALEYSFGAVCINQIHVELCAELLEGSETEVCTVVGFPLGASYSSIKAAEADLALSHGATEIDMVINIQKVRDGDWDAAYADVSKVVEMVKGRGVTKVIFETGYLTREEIVQTCNVCEKAGADYVKTSTGFGVMGATYDHVKLMRHTVGDRMKIKAAGAIRDFKSAMYMVKAGADRLGTSAGVAIIEGLSWMKYTSSWLNNPNPCYYCPSRMAPYGKMSGSTYKYYKAFCLDCPNKEFNVFND
jgi:deoxyribose-phosphate aldolase